MGAVKAPPAARGARLALFEATSLTAKGVKDQLAARSFPVTSVRLFTSSTDPDANLTEFKGEAMLVTAPDEEGLGSLDIAFLCGGREEGERRGPPGMPGGVPGPGAEMGQIAVPADAWIFRFIDTTIEAGYQYRYRVKFKMHNPNLGRNPRELATSDLAQHEELESNWFVIKDLVRSPQDEFLYAAADQRGANPPRASRRAFP